MQGVRGTSVYLACMFGWAGVSGVVRADEPRMSLSMRTRVEERIASALKYLETTQRPDGAWEANGEPNLGVTSLVVKCFLQDAKYGPDHPVAKRGLAFMLKNVQPDGGIYVESEGVKNYHTSVALMALASTKRAEHAKVIKDAQDFLRELQWDAGEGHESSDPFYGGQGYGSGKRPDLSNTQLMLEALHESGLPPDDPVYKKALVFVNRCQMLSESNDQPFAKGATDGGFIYSPCNGGESKAGTESVDGQSRLRSYGSMTYAGFKSLLYAKLDRNDPRVKQAVDWIRKNYTLDGNPGMPDSQAKQGLYYYYHAFARAMRAWGEDEFRDSKNTPRNWRTELCEKLLSAQKDNGSWANEADRWLEGSPHLVTAYAVLALQTALQP